MLPVFLNQCGCGSTKNLVSADDSSEECDLGYPLGIWQCPVNVQSDRQLTVSEFAVQYLNYKEDNPEARCHYPELFMLPIMKEWKVSKTWFLQNGEGKKLHYKWLQDVHGGVLVPVTSCTRGTYGEQTKRDMMFADYIQYLLDIKRGCEDKDKLYLKDWHFTRDIQGSELYSTPPYFISDWLNEYWDCKSVGDDYRFLYLGTRNTWTPFHADVFRSHSWSANVCGEKKWMLFPPGSEKLYEDKFGNLPSDISQEIIDGKRECGEDDWQEPLSVIQKPGQVIFVPSNWHHQVTNLSDVTLSINHNWVNASNIHHVWKFLCDTLEKVEAAISDCRGMDGFDGQCQLILHADVGMDMMGYYLLLVTTCYNRLSFISSHQLELPLAHSPPPPHLLSRIARMLTECYNIKPCDHVSENMCSLCKRLQYASHVKHQRAPASLLRDEILHDLATISRTLTHITQHDAFNRLISAAAAASNTSKHFVTPEVLSKHLSGLHLLLDYT